jgi:hypothetical protein
VRERLIVPPIHSSEVACAQRSRVGHRENALQPLDFSNGLLGVHSVSIIQQKRRAVKRDGINDVSYRTRSGMTANTASIT